MAAVANISNCQAVLTACQRSVAACTARLAVVADSFKTAKATYRTALAACIKDDTESNIQARDSARDDMNTARDARDASKAELATAQEAEAKAQANMKQELAARSRANGTVPGMGNMSAPCVATDDTIHVVETSYVDAAKAAFADISALKCFPVPANKSTCVKPACLKAGKGALCEHILASVFAGSSAKELKVAKGVFAPAQFKGNKEFEGHAHDVCAAISKAIAKCGKNVESYQKGKQVSKNQSNRTPAGKNFGRMGR